METTTKLYDSDAYQTNFTATVLSCSIHPDTPGASLAPAYDIILDRTVFFPEEGGQGADTGLLNGCAVMDVQITKGIIIHTLDAPLPVGSTVSGCIDRFPRFSNMQQHSGEHILSGLVHSHFGYENVGFHLGSQTVTLDFNGFLDKNQMELLETQANEAIYENIEITADYPAPNQLISISYRSKLDLQENVRIVTIPGYDICACCAPHVKRTGEIGIIKITDAVRYKGGIRITILCGSRALEDYRRKQEWVTAISVLTSAKPEFISEAVTRLKEENYSLNGKLTALEEAFVERKAASVFADTMDSDLICLFEEALAPAAHRKYVNLLTANYTGICAVFSGCDSTGYRFIIASETKDVRPLNILLKEQLQAKGGGTGEMVQGSIHKTEAEIRTVISA